MTRFRPWGTIASVLAQGEQKKWGYLGVFGTEQRSLEGWTYLKAREMIDLTRLVQIEDALSVRYEERIRQLTQERKSYFLAQGGKLGDVQTVPLLASLLDVEQIAREVAQKSESVALDVSSLPKRFLFPILRFLVRSGDVQNLVLFYTRPREYAPASEPLYEDIQQWDALPGFGGEQNDEGTWIVSVGFMVETLSEYVNDHDTQRMVLLVPFPSSPEVMRRTQRSVAALERGHRRDRFDQYLVDPSNLSAAFDRIAAIAAKEGGPVTFAPFGPKPVSAAMCLYALLNGSAVLYPQPTVYHPEYSRGVSGDNASDAIVGYWIKHGGICLYP